MPKSLGVGCSDHNTMGKKGLTFQRKKKNEKWKQWFQATKRVNVNESMENMFTLQIEKV